MLNRGKEFNFSIDPTIFRRIKVIMENIFLLVISTMLGDILRMGSG
jgi:hypothetical protein